MTFLEANIKPIKLFDRNTISTMKFLKIANQIIRNAAVDWGQNYAQKIYLPNQIKENLENRLGILIIYFNYTLSRSVERQSSETL